MSKLLHLKASRTRILDAFASKTFGKDGDIIISRIRGKGVYLCTKSHGSWYTLERMSPLSNVDKTPLNIFAKKVRIKDIKNSSFNTDKFVVSENGDLKYRTSKEVLSDLGTDSISINYKTAYCSLAQYNDKETCESNGGTWYYSENDSHDSISSTAENELLTIGSSIGKIDAESTLTYDGSTLEIKRNSDFDDNWQTSAQDDLLKLSYDSSNNALFGVDSSGNLSIDVSGDITLDAGGADIKFLVGGASYMEWTALGTLIMKAAANRNDSANFTVGNNGIFTIATTDADTTVGHITLDADGDIICDPATGYTKISGSTLLIEEQADANADLAGYGQIWVDTATPNELAFTDDAGTDIIGIGKYQYDSKFIAFNTSNTYAWLPMNGYIIEGSSSTGRNEYQAFIAPYNGTLIKYQWRTEVAQGGSNHSLRINEATDGTEIPGTIIYRKDYDPGLIADDITTEWDFSSPSVGTDPPAFTKGRLYMIYVSFASAPLDTNVNMVFKWDITS